jgi:CRP-like cAMP-binding protein
VATESAPGRLSAVGLLAGLTPGEIVQLEQACSWRRYKAGEQILDRNSASRDVFFVAEGTVQIVNYSVAGREVNYASVPAGGFFGELSAIDSEPRSATAVADGPCLLAALPPRAFEELLRRHPEIAVQVLRRLARIIRICDERIMDLATLGAVQRVHLELLRMAKPDLIAKGSWVIYPLPRQQEIASRASTTRETVARVLSQLAASKLILRKGKSVYLNDRAALEQLAERLAAQGSDTSR